MTKKDFIYEAPEVSVMELHNEGVLCSSFETYNEENLDWGN